MKQILRKGLKDIIVDEVPDPMISPYHILVRPIYSLISSGTETASIHKEGVARALANDPSQLRKVWNAMKDAPIRTVAEVRAKLTEYAVLGYSGAGLVAEKDSRVKDIEIGDRVAYGGEGTGHAETILVGRNLATKVPENVPFEHACFTTLGSISLNAVRIAKISLGERVAVIGLGLVGQLISQLARLQGGFIIATDLKPDRIELARRLGADEVVSGTSDVAGQIRALTDGNGVDCVIVAAAAKSDAPCRMAVEICRDRGRIVDVGAVELTFPWYETYLKEIQIFMARAYGPGSYDPSYERDGQDYPAAYVRWTENRNMEEFLRLLSQGKVQIEPLITHRFAMEDADRAYETIMDPVANSLAVLVKYPAADLEEPLANFRPKRRVEVHAHVATSKVGVALIGAGNLARWAHLPNIKKTPLTHLRAIHSSSGARGKSYAARFGADYCATDYSEILNDPEIQAVVIVSRNPQHASQALAALRAGKNVFVEKPMALTQQECRDLYQAVEESRKQLTVGFNRRFAPTYLSLKKQLAQRSGPAVVNCRVNSPGISGSYWMADPAIGGAILGEACHFIDLLYWLLDSEPVEVTAYSLPTGKMDPIGENNLVAAFRFADDSIANFTYCTVGSRTSGGERVEGYAPGLGAIAEDFKWSVIRTGAVRKTSTWFAEKGYEAQMRDFFDSLKQGRPAQVTVRDGVRSTLGCLLMLESARTRAARIIDIEEFLGPPLQ
jgi:predicted dehydrogenase/threonine dehydrogenase-like Zn-dependent dehydrogenase